MVCAFGQLIKPPLLSEVEMLNVHPSLLPRWRGAAPIERAIMAGDSETGVAIMRLAEGLDSGPVAMCERVAIGAQEDFGSLSERLADLGGELAVRALELREAGELNFAEQAEDGVTYAEKIEAEDRRLDPARPAVDLERAVRALTPHVGAFIELAAGDRLGVTRAAAEPGDSGAGSLFADGDALVLGTASGRLRICAVKPAGKREMSAEDYLRGNPSLESLDRPCHAGAAGSVRSGPAGVRARRVGGPRLSGRRRAPRPRGARSRPGPADRIRRGAAPRNDRSLRRAPDR